MRGISSPYAVINPRRRAILAVGEVGGRPVIRDLSTAHLIDVTLVCDRRILYGADGAEFLGGVSGLLEEPGGLAV